MSDKLKLVENALKLIAGGGAEDATSAAVRAAQNSALIKDAKRLGVDTNDVGALKETKALTDFHKGFMSDMGDRARELSATVRRMRDEGRLPMEVGTRFSTIHSRENGLPPWTVMGYHANPKNPEASYGYRVRREFDNGDYEETDHLVRDPRLEEIHGPEKWKMLQDGVMPMTGPRVVKADGGALGADDFRMSPEERDAMARAADPYYSVPGHESLPLPSEPKPEPSLAAKIGAGTASAFDNTVGGLPAFVASTAQHSVGRPVQFALGLTAGLTPEQALAKANAIDEDWQKTYEAGATPAGSIFGVKDTPAYQNEVAGQAMRGFGEHILTPAVQGVSEATGLPEADVQSMANIGMLAGGSHVGKLGGAALEAAAPETAVPRTVAGDLGARGAVALEGNLAKDRIADRGPAKLYDPLQVASGVDPTKIGPAAANAVDKTLAKLGDAAQGKPASAGPGEAVDNALRLAREVSGASADVPPGVDLRAPTKDFVQHGKPIPPTTPPPPPDVVAAAKADTRMGADVVKKRLPIIVPEQERVVGGVYVPGAPDGRRWSDLTPAELSVRGPGAHFNDADLGRIWDETLSEVSEAGRQAVANTGATWQAFPSAGWNNALKLPLRSQLWYEVSGEAFIDRLPDLRYNEHMMFLDLVGATSARAKPGENLERSLAVLSQRLRGVPVDVDVTIPSTVSAALRRDGRNVSSDLANKTGMFSDTLALTGGLPVRYPISVNDVWVGKAFGITDDALSANQALHEVFGKYTNKLRDLVNSDPRQPFPHQSWNLQARQWVEMRARDEGVDTSLGTSVDGSDYAGEWDRVIGKLQAAGIDVPDGKLTRDILLDPRTADALRTTTPGFRGAPKATVEFGTLLTPNGRKAASIFDRAKKLEDQNTQDEYLTTLTSAMYQSARGKGTPWENLIRVAKGDSTNLTRIYSPTSDDPFAISGTFGGAASPNIRIPLRGATPDQIAYFNAVAGKGLRQKAMAAVEISRLMPGEPLPEGAVPSHAVRFDFDGPVPQKMLTDFASTLGEGYEISAMRYPDGVVFDINPRFGDNGPEAPSIADVDRAVDHISKTYGATNPKVFDIGYKSEYGKHYVEDPGNGSGYGKVIADTIKTWQNDALARLSALTDGRISNASLKKFLAGDDAALKAGAAKAGIPVSGFAGRASTIRKELQQRLGDHAAVQAQFNAVGKEVDTKLGSLIPKWERRHATATKRNFDDAFGQTHLKTPQGDPMRLYHMTPKDITEFNAGEGNRSGPVVFLSPYKDVQPAYHQNGLWSADEKQVLGFKEGANVMPVYADIRSPLVLDHPRKIREAAAKYQGGDRQFPRVVSPEAKAAMEADGFDGIIFGGDNPIPYGKRPQDARLGHQEMRDEEIIVFNPKRIKSAISNSGRYDTTKGDITKARGGAVTGFEKRDTSPAVSRALALTSGF